MLNIMGRNMVDAAMAKPSITVQRRTGDSRVNIPAGGKVRPNEGIWLQVEGACSTPALGIFKVTFTVKAQDGREVFKQTEGLGFGCSESVFFTAPSVPGIYTAKAATGPVNIPFVSQSDETTFEIDPNAPAPPDPPPGGFGFGGLVSALPKILFGVVGVVVVTSVLKR